MEENITASQSRENIESSAVKPEKENLRDGSTFTVKHNKETKELTLDELIAAAEKGLDYDRIRPSHDFVKNLAAKEGETDVGRYIGRMSGLKGQSAEQAPQDAARDSQIAEFGQLVAEYPEVVRDGRLSIPQEVEGMLRKGMNPLDAFRAYDLKRTKEECAELKARLTAEQVNRSNRTASVGSLTGGDAVEKGYYSSAEWDRLPEQQKARFIKSGKVFEFMKKWSGN